MASHNHAGAGDVSSGELSSLSCTELSLLDNGSKSLDVPYSNTTLERREHIANTRKTRRAKEVTNDENLIGALCTWIVDHQIGIAMNLLLLLGLTHMCFPRARRHTSKFFRISYYNVDSRRYGLGWDDVFMVFHWIIVFTGLRVGVMEYILVPLAEWLGISKKKERIRFAEQAWIYAYYAVFWSLGMYIMYNSDYWLNLENMWVGWPDREMDGLCKWYYLVQFAFWLQQILVVNIEERRKDYAQMFTHHLVTCALMLSSYGYHHTKIGNVILCIMDSVETIFPLAKMLKYLKFQTACDTAFVAFMILWVISRHIAYNMVVLSIYTDLPKHIQFGCYQGSNANLKGPFDSPSNLSYLIAPFLDPEGLVCQTETMQTIFVGMLVFLQGILLVWFVMIVRVATKVIQGKKADDPRSDDETGDEELQDDDLKQQRDYIAVRPNIEDIDVEAPAVSGRKSSPARRYKRAAVAASGVSLPHDRKELLGRIGCDKGA